MIRSPEERHKKLEEILQTAEKIAKQNPKKKSNQDAWSYLQFCTRHGYIGYPTESISEINAGNYLHPQKAHTGPENLTAIQTALGIIVCFSDEQHPSLALKAQTLSAIGLQVVISSYVVPQNRLLVIGSADIHTPFALGLMLLHEARHARHCFGPEFGGLDRLDPEPLHESRTWKYELDLLDALESKPWVTAVHEETNLLARYYKQKGRTPGEKFYASSGKPYPQLAELFGTPAIPSVAEWGMLVSMRANFILVEKDTPKEKRDQPYANIVDAYCEYGK